MGLIQFCFDLGWRYIDGDYIILFHHQGHMLICHMINSRAQISLLAWESILQKQAIVGLSLLLGMMLTSE